MRTTWTLALLALAAAAALALTACGDNVPPGPIDAPPCDLVSCEAGAAFECCPLAPPPPPSRTRDLSPLVAAVASGWLPDFGATSGLSRGCMRATGFNGRFAKPVGLDHGDRMLSLVAAIDGDSSSEIDLVVAGYVRNVDAVSVIGALTVPNVPAGWHDYAIDLTDTTIDGDTWYAIEVVADQPGACVGAFRLTYDRPEEL